MQPFSNQPQQPSRRGFLKASALTAGAALAAVPTINVLGADTARKFKVALIGCGGRGGGALRDHVAAAKHLNDKLSYNLEIELVAAADWFANKAKSIGKHFGLDESKCFSGGDCYRKALEQKPDIVIMGQPPVVRPLHFEAAIDAGCHVFFEKPVAVDPPGIRRVLKAGAKATEKGLSVVAGTQRRHEKGYIDTWRKLQAGTLGRVLAGRVAWNMGKIFTNTPINPRGPDQLCGPWQIWVEMSGDHICEQHVHNIDIANWFIGTHPKSAGGFGFRARRVAGNMYDFFSVDLEYPNDVYVHSMCRQIGDCWDWVGESFVYDKSGAKDAAKDVPDPYAEPGYPGNGYVNEHVHLLWSIVKDKRLNEAQDVAWATGAAILARESAYSGKRITWDEMFEKPGGKFYDLLLSPTAEDFEKPNVPLLKDGDIRIPGV